MTLIKNVLNFVPEKKMTFENWEQEYKTDIDNIFGIFVSRLKDVDPFNKQSLNKQAFVKLLYKYS